MGTYNPYEGRDPASIKVKYFINLPPELKITKSTLRLSAPRLQKSENYYFRGSPVAALVRKLSRCICGRNFWCLYNYWYYVYC